MSAAPGAVDEAAWQPKAIVFDLLTALLDSWTLWTASTPSGSAAEGRRWRERYLAVTFGAGAYVPYEALVAQAARDVGLAPAAPAALLRGWEEGGLRAWPEAGAVLRALRARRPSCRLAVATNCSMRLGRAAAAAAAPPAFAFDAVLTAEQSGFYKPARPAYAAVLAALGVEPADALFVAGSPGDVQGAADAGMRVVWHNRIGLPMVGDAVPLREGKTLDEALQDFL
ncbi:putative 2-deoxyglucose-6-phosphate phosphatase [Durotheca rogersii]|uniref:putative 2-deoxyglucose-6-phosphate phosphatase n=1 Tax=Durotheca rogersii TaxID=419775 RepID=UPI00222048D8|nr:putative 2-deoxyglucose-6-phosphate phosphatase [Durotheca rogersii]KAI5861224.1 putative 2-deoxyglucose-6-phosphate phosphatase [Durotheca rogersii]